MFDAVEIGRRISRLRKEKDMTQPALADIMGVSFQAVSNWERGASMPDIGKLPELAQALDVSVDELLGSGRGGKLIRSVIDGAEETFVRQEHMTISEAGEAAPLLRPKQVTRIVKAIDEENEKRQKEGAREEGKTSEASGGIDIENLILIAPFLDEEYLDELAFRLAPSTGLKKLAGIAPFLSEDALDRLAGEAYVHSARISEISAIAPFLSEEGIDRLALRAVNDEASLGELASIAPFLSEETLGKIASEAIKNGGSIEDVAKLAPFLDEDDLGKIALSCVEDGGSPLKIAAIAPFLDEDDLDKIVHAALKSGQPVGELVGLFPFLSKDALRELIEAALKKNDTSFLSKASRFL